MIPHVSQLAGIKPAPAIQSTIETVADLEQLLQTAAIPGACQWLVDNIDGGCVCEECTSWREMFGNNGRTEAFAKHGPFWWYATATAWRAYAADEPLDAGFMAYEYADDSLIRFWDSWPPLYVRHDDYVSHERGHQHYHYRDFQLETITDRPQPRLSDVALPVLELVQHLDWRKTWTGRAEAGGDRYGEHPTDNALFEYWRCRHLIRKERASGARQRALDAMRAKTDPLQPYALDYARRALLEPLNAAITAALAER